MKRMEFLKEMSSSLGKTLKSIYHPMVEDDVEKLSKAAQQALGIKWHFLSIKNEVKQGVELKFISGKPIIIVQTPKGNMQAISGICPVCSNLLVFSSLYSTGKCLICEKDYNFITMTGHLEYTVLPVKLEEERLFVGLSK